MQTSRLFVGILAFCCLSPALGNAEELLFEDKFDSKLSDKWDVVGLAKEDYRIRNGGLEMKVQRDQKKSERAYLRVNLPFKTSDTVTASVEVSVVDKPLERHDLAGLTLLDPEGRSFTVRKTNIDGFHVFAPGEVDFIGKEGQEGDPGKYTVKYWPADKAAGPLRIIVRGDYAYFQVGPSTDGKYQNFFHSAIRSHNKGNGFGLIASGPPSEVETWVRFDNFRVVRN
jgi:hypothetical protein